MKYNLTQEAVDWYFNRDLTPFADMKKAKLICDMRLEGFTLEQIGKRVGLTKSRVNEYIRKVLRRYETNLKRF